ncbi:MAG: hypothetical protein AM326_10980 [Candidatus Thorarchaeota archaeon SMTZ-45]|nr:MAG: hypothetical protein AM326_10980 [Candidatus Thorarchaeota archaeon SMTZ-45]
MDVVVPKFKRWKKMKGKTVSMICPKHGYKRMSECDECAKERETAGPAVHIFKPMVYEDITDHPILIRSKKHLKEECKKHDVIAARLL